MIKVPEAIRYASNKRRMRCVLQPNVERCAEFFFVRGFFQRHAVSEQILRFLRDEICKEIAPKLIVRTVVVRNDFPVECIKQLLKISNRHIPVRVVFLRNNRLFV